MNKNKGFFIVVSAPSGTGKTSLCQALMARHPSLRLSVSHTSRAPRAGEENGKDYHFASKDEFRRKIVAGDFVEWVEYYGNFYGTSSEAIDAIFLTGSEAIFDIEPRGAKALKNCLLGKGIFIFIMPPSIDELKNRLIKRSSEGAGQMAKRLAQAQNEIDEANWYDHIIVNDDFNTALTELEAIYLSLKQG